MNLKQQIEKKEKELEVLREKLKQELDKSEWIYIPELKIEVQTKIHHLNKTLSEAMKDLKKGESVITYEQIQWLRNSKYAKQLNLIKTRGLTSADKIILFTQEFVTSDSGCDRSPTDTVASLGVRFVRKFKEKK